MAPLRAGTARRTGRQRRKSHDRNQVGSECFLRCVAVRLAEFPARPMQLQGLDDLLRQCVYPVLSCLWPYATHRAQQGGRFTGRLQLAPGLVPPTSWSFPRCGHPKIYCRAESLKSPGLDAIYLKLVRSIANLSVDTGGDCIRDPMRCPSSHGFSGAQITDRATSRAPFRDDHHPWPPGKVPLRAFVDTF